MELERYTRSRTARATTWADLPPHELRREAMKAANIRDAERLWSLTEAFLVLHGRAGANISEHTIDNYSRGIRQLLEHWSGENLLRPGREAARRYLRELEDAGRSPGTIEVKLAAARLLYKALRWSEATDAVPFENVHAPKDPTPPEEKRQAYTRAAVDALLEHAGELDRAMVLLAAHGGLRVAEILSLEWRDVDLEALEIHVRSGKGRKARKVRMSSPLAAALAALAGDEDLAGPVMPFRSANRARQRLKDLCRRAGVGYLGVHSLRHYCATALYQISGGELLVPARHLGHANTSTTEIYAKMDRRTINAAVAQL